MPMPSKFTAATRKTILEALRIGASRNTAAHVAGIDEATLRRWIKAGSGEEAGVRYADFRREVLAAEAEPKMRALGVIWREMPDKPDLAMKFIERREPGFAPPMPAGQTTEVTIPHITLSFAGVPAPALPSTIIEGEVVDEQDEQPGTVTPIQP